MSHYQNRAIVLAKRPQGEPKDNDFRLETGPVRALQDGEILIRILWLSLDPYMRPDMNDMGADMDDYVEPMPLDHVIVGESVGEVIESRSERFAVGDHVTALTGWQEYFIAAENEPMMYKIEPAGVPLSAYLGAAGMTGRTGYLGLTRLAKPQEGETLVVSAASGAVGTVVGQVGKMLGCRVIGIAGGEAKCRYVQEELGFDDCIDYKSGDLAVLLQGACPGGIDIYFEGVGGEVTRAVAPLLNKGSRVPVCGYVAHYNSLNLEAAETPFDILGALPEPPEHRFFEVTEWQDEHQEVTSQLADWIRVGKIRYRESVAEGLEQAVAGFRGMLRGENFGKQLVRIAGEAAESRTDEY
jgi:NADPH-dependent curcumin reductase CurA